MRRLIWLALLTLLALQPLYAQLRDIDVNGLPANVTTAYQTILPYNEALRNYTAKWTEPTPKAVVIKQFNDALKTFQNAQRANSENLELALLTGFAAHLAYNLDIETAYPVAVKMLNTAATLKPNDPRPEWFLGIHECETAHPVPGMERFLRVERSQTALPAGFWRDYALCSQIVNMPAHAAKAYDLIGGEKNPLYISVETIDKRAIAPSDTTKKYDVATVWSTGIDGDHIRFTSYLCGLAFSADAKAEVDPHSVQDATCAVTITPPGYLREVKFHTPTLLILSKIVEASETLESFTEKLGHLKARHAKIVTFPCPVDPCIAYEVHQPDMYAEAGGAHLLMVAFRSETPRYPGLLLETPMGPPIAEGNKVQYYRPAELPHRFAGTMMTVVIMDASEAIYDSSRTDFEKLITSLTIDR